MSSDDDFRGRTLARLESIRSHLQNAPRGTRLKDKVCIITGVGSLKGIGFVSRCRPVVSSSQTSLADGQLPSCSRTKVSARSARRLYPAFHAPDVPPGARHLYLADFDPTNLPDLKSTIEKTYPDVKVCCLLVARPPTLNHCPLAGHHPTGRRRERRDNRTIVQAGSSGRGPARCLLCECDFASAHDSQRSLIMFHQAGIATSTRFWDTTPEQFMEVMRVNALS